MTDMLLDLGQRSWFRQTVRTLGLPIPMPQALRRVQGPWTERPLEGRELLVGAGPSPDVLPTVADTLATTGALTKLWGEHAAAEPFTTAGEAYGRPPVLLGTNGAGEDTAVNGLVFDATGIASVGELASLYTFFHAWIGRLRTCARIVVVARPAGSQKTAGAAAASKAIEGFIRSVAKEIGRKGATANAVFVERGADKRLLPVLAFLLSDRSAFLTGQVFYVNRRIKGPDEIPLAQPLDNKVALVTGAARGIGAATAEALAAEGAHVICLDRPADGDLVAKIARNIGGSALLADITDAEAPDRIAEAVNNQQGGVDVVIHNAGITRDKTLGRMSEDQWQQAIDVNLDAVVRITERLESDGLRDQGRVVCLASVAGIAGNFGQTNYAASKSGVIGFVEAMAPGLAKRGIAINAVAPGFIETRLTAAIPTMQREVGRRLSALGQGGLPSDVADLITFLSTPGAYGLCGQVIRICGGMYVGA